MFSPQPTFADRNLNYIGFSTATVSFAYFVFRLTNYLKLLVYDFLLGIADDTHTIAFRGKRPPDLVYIFSRYGLSSLFLLIKLTLI